MNRDLLRTLRSTQECLSKLFRQLQLQHSTWTICLEDQSAGLNLWLWHSQLSVVAVLTPSQIYLAVAQSLNQSLFNLQDKLL